MEATIVWRAGNCHQSRRVTLRFRRLVLMMVARWRHTDHLWPLAVNWLASRGRRGCKLVWQSKSWCSLGNISLLRSAGALFSKARQYSWVLSLYLDLSSLELAGAACALSSFYLIIQAIPELPSIIQTFKIVGTTVITLMKVPRGTLMRLNHSYIPRSEGTAAASTAACTTLRHACNLGASSSHSENFRWVSSWRSRGLNALLLLEEKFGGKKATWRTRIDDLCCNGHRKTSILKLKDWQIEKVNTPTVTNLIDTRWHLKKDSYFPIQNM